MAGGRESRLQWFFAFIGGAIPIAFTVAHVLNQERFGMEDVPLWPTSYLLVGKDLTTFQNAALFAVASLLNIAWYMGIGWFVLQCLKTFKGED